jgi:hypothetical protein
LGEDRRKSELENIIKIINIDKDKEINSFNSPNTNNEDCELMKKMKKDKKKSKIPLINYLTSTIGMIGKKLDLEGYEEKKYQFWDCVTKKDHWLINKFNNFETREKLVEFCKRSFLKAYPSSFNSDNYDCLKTWLVGSQISAINIQKLDDDDTLLNFILFKKNRKSGYILKPKKFRCRKTKYLEKYLHPVKKLSLTLISGYLLNLMGFDNQTGKFKIKFNELKIIIKIKGTHHEDSQKQFELDLGENLINPHFYEKKIEFDIYEPELSCIFIYLSDHKHIIGRTILPLSMISEGIRSVSLYDEKSQEFNESRLILKIELFD